MRLPNKKIVLLLIAVWLFCGGSFAYSAGTDANDNSKSWLDNYKSSGGYDPNSNNQFGRTNDTGRLLLSVFIVFVLGVAAIYLSKKVLPKFTHSTGKKIQVVETVHLGPRKAIHLIKIGSQTLLIGSTNENITKLADVTDQLFEVDLPANPIDNN